MAKSYKSFSGPKQTRGGRLRVNATFRCFAKLRRRTLSDGCVAKDSIDFGGGLQKRRAPERKRRMEERDKEEARPDSVEEAGETTAADLIPTPVDSRPVGEGTR